MILSLAQQRKFKETGQIPGAASEETKRVLITGGGFMGKNQLLPQYDFMVRAKSASRANDVEDVETQADKLMQNTRISLAAFQGKSTICAEAI
ncbi:hypothetical protein [Maridesulfovibrio sp.]|uniref:hypothetical protein n=1 Tax=Maridesulfovibrio sp. TaxID=2795000 RepID=UPI0029CA50CE|nr:hypothetical protein [Maridesulfovibrio sp.]